MKILLLAGSHSRHVHFFQGLLGLDADFSVLGMQREAQLPSTPDSLQTFTPTVCWGSTPSKETDLRSIRLGWAVNKTG